MWRYYKPDSETYLRTDPIGIHGGINLFVYVIDNPVNFEDPLGLYDESDFWFDAFTSERSDDYYEYEDDLKMAPMEESAKLKGCIITRSSEYILGDIEQRGGKFAVRQVLKSAVKIALLSYVDKAITIWSAYGLIECTGRCCNE